MSLEREGRNTPSTGTGDHVVVNIIPAETPETPGRLVIPDALPTMTIGELRLRVQALIPSHPELQRLRLICAGALLSRDNATLQQIVGEDELRSRKTVTIHLALRPGPDGPVQSRPATVPPPMAGVPQATVPAPVRAPIPRGMGAMRALVPSGSAIGPASTPVTGQPPQMLPNPNLQNLEQQTEPQMRTQDEQTRTLTETQIAERRRVIEEQRRANYEALMRQHQQLHQTNQAILQQMTGRQVYGQQVMGQQVAGQQVVGQPGPVFVQAPWGVQQPPLSLQDFQRHLNQQHVARQGQVENPTQAAPHTSGPTTPAGGDNQQSQPSAVGAAAPTPAVPTAPVPHLPPNPPVVLGGIPFALPGARPMPAPNMHMARLPQPLGSGHSSGMYSAASSSYSARAQPDTIYLLQSPDGYQAILIGPSSQNRGVALPVQPPTNMLSGTWTRTTRVQQNVAAPTNPENAANARIVQNNEARQDRVGAPRQIGLRDLLGILIPFGTHLWLLIRLTFIALFMCWGASWTRTAVVCIGFAVLFLFQTGLMRPVQNIGEQMWAPIRQHIDQLVRDIDAQEGPAAPTDEPAQAPQRPQRDQGLVRRMERSVALFLASFVPGIGESQVRAREEAERRRRRAIEEREEQARREEEERAQAAQEQADQVEGDEATPSGPDKGLGNSTPRIGPSDPADMGPSPIVAPTEDKPDGLRQRQPRVDEASDDEA